jgi:hypothetical protein
LHAKFHALSLLQAPRSSSRVTTCEAKLGPRDYWFSHFVLQKFNPNFNHDNCFRWALSSLNYAQQSILKMEPPPPPTSGRFRLRVQIYGPQDAHNLSATPLRQFTIVKNPTLPLTDLTLQQLCDEVVKRFKAIYSREQ